MHALLESSHTEMMQMKMRKKGENDVLKSNVQACSMPMNAIWALAFWMGCVLGKDVPRAMRGLF